MPPSPCRTRTSESARAFTSSGCRVVNSGRKPLNRAVRSTAGDVLSMGMVVPSGSVGWTGPGSREMFMYRWPIMLRNRRLRWTFPGRVRSPARVKYTLAWSRSWISKSVTCPTTTPAIRTSSPSSSMVASEKIAEYSVPFSRVPPRMVVARTVDSRPVTTMKMTSLTNEDSSPPRNSALSLVFTRTPPPSRGVPERRGHRPSPGSRRRHGRRRRRRPFGRCRSPAGTRRRPWP